MINTLVLVGVIDRVHISEGKTKDKASGAIVLRYGDDRNQSGGAVEFINAALVRIPPYRLPAVRDRLQPGAFVHLIGHIQGLFKHQAGQGVLDTELVADRIDFVQGLNSVHNAYRKGRGTPPRGNGAEGPEQDKTSGHDSVAGDPMSADALLAGAAMEEVATAPEDSPESATAA
ncbi:MAG: single stranded DNA-binding domain-containing protein [Steroidobacteraceae bacterium]|jgi:hypothetical protein